MLNYLWLALVLLEVPIGDWRAPTAEIFPSPAGEFILYRPTFHK
jgi:hypothetical protein